MAGFEGLFGRRWGRMNHLILIFLTALLGWGSLLHAAELPPVQSMKAFLEATYPDHEPGATVLVKKGDVQLLRAAYGKADLELGVAMQPDMVLRLGSITKQFTAVAILQLVASGQIELEAPITKYLPDYPEHKPVVTVTHLLTHTSGIVSYTGMQSWLPTIKEDFSTAEMAAMFKDKPLEFEPGTQFRYNNSGYFLLGMIIEKVSGMTYANYIQKHIFEPLNMQQSYYGDHSTIIPRRAKGFSHDAGRWVNSSYMSMSQPYAAGSLLSTVDDLAKWDTALYQGRILEKPLLEKAWQAYQLKSGDSTNYGFGWAITKLRGLDCQGHGGGINGFQTQILRVPEERVLVVVLGNREGGNVDPGMVARRLAAMAVGNPYPNFKRVQLDSEKLKEFVGVYNIEKSSDLRTVRLEGEQITTQRGSGGRRLIFAAGKDRFFYERSLTYLDFQRDDSGKVTGMMAYQGGDRQEYAAKTNQKVVADPVVAEVDPAIFADFVGTYEMRPGVEIAVSTREKRLFVQLTGQPQFEIFPSSATEYFLKVVEAKIVFERNEAGAISQLVLHQNGQVIPAKRLP